MDSIQQIGKFGVLAIASIVALVMVISTPSANAATNCRKVMRDLQVQLTGVTNDPNKNASPKAVKEMAQIVQEKILSFPECKSDFIVWYKWNLNFKPSTPFPFSEAGDPRTYILGPISWWWDKIYLDLFGGNIALMFFFGWELFLGGLYAALAIPFAILGALIPGLGKLASYPFKIWSRRKRNKES